MNPASRSMTASRSRLRERCEAVVAPPCASLPSGDMAQTLLHRMPGRGPRLQDVYTERAGKWDTARAFRRRPRRRRGARPLLRCPSVVAIARSRHPLAAIATLAALIALICAPSALADGDPASDVLLGQNV